MYFLEKFESSIYSIVNEYLNMYRLCVSEGLVGIPNPKNRGSTIYE